MDKDKEREANKEDWKCAASEAVLNEYYESEGICGSARVNLRCDYSLTGYHIKPEE